MKGDGGMTRVSEDDLTRAVIDAIIHVHRTLGPGFLEGVYHRALLIELQRRRLPFSTEVEVAVMYEGQPVGRHRMDLVIDGRLIVELKTVEELNRSHYAQVRAYLKATGLPVALLVNFTKAKADYRRIEAYPHIPNHPHISDSQFRAAEGET